MKKKGLAVLGLTAAMSLSLPLMAHAGQWQQDANGWWWQEDDGSYPTDGWKWIDGNYDGIAECYYFASSGYILSGTTTPDNYTVDENGAWVVNGVVQQQAVQETSQTSTVSLDEWKDNFRKTWRESAFEGCKKAQDELAGQLAIPAMIYHTFTVPQTDGLTSEIVSDLCDEIHNDFTALSYRASGYYGCRWQWRAHDGMITVEVLDALISYYPSEDEMRSYGFPVD